MLDNVTSIVTSAGIPSGYPEQLHGEDISFIYTEDLRFRKHAMVNISWPRPRGIIISELHVLNLVTCVISGYQTIERYQITVFSDPEVVDSCGGFINTYNIFQKVRPCEFIR